MKKILIAGFPLAVILAASSSAVEVGGTLFIKSKNTKLFANPSPTAPVVELLQPGASVVWKGADATKKRWHHVKSGANEGVVFQSNPSPKPPSMELVASEGGKEVDPQAFASSGAATKALGDAAVKYGESKDMSEVVVELDAVISLSDEVTPSDIANHVEQAGLFSVVEGGR
jgi:hypothetical protein